MDWSLGKLSKLLRKTKKTFANQMSLSPKLKTLRKIVKIVRVLPEKAETYSKPCRTWTMEVFANIVDG